MRRDDGQRKEKAEVHGNRTQAENAEKIVNSLQGGAESGALGAENTSIDPDLQAIVESWPDLSDAVKASILTTMRAAVKAQ